jgi:carbamoylphosphate synthase large subunit
VLERYPFLEAETARLVAELDLHGLFNVQFKDRYDDEPFLLEINARMSGGIAMSCLRGMVFPYWAVKIALDPSAIEQIPAQRTGSVRVTEVSTPVVLSVPQHSA